MIRDFGTTQNGGQVRAITLSSGDISATILTLGATLQDLRISGIDHAMTLGCDDVSAYETSMQYFGALVGPVANRIAHSRAPLEGETLILDANEGETSLHSGPNGIHTEIWQIENHSDSHLCLALKLPDGKGGLPGNRCIRAHFSVHAPAELRLVIDAETDAPTLMNIANHSYWNLDGSASISGQILTVPARHYAPVDQASIPTGIADVSGTDFDFQNGRFLGENTPRVDHNFCLRDQRGDLITACELRGKNGVTLRMETTEAGLQVYDAGEQKSAPHSGLNSTVYEGFCGVALEAQAWPDAPNQDGFASINLYPEAPYRQETRWIFTMP